MVEQDRDYMNIKKYFEGIHSSQEVRYLDDRWIMKGGQGKKVLQWQTKQVPMREDYIKYFKDKGEIGNEQDIYSREDLVKMAQFHWRYQGKIGCNFAVTLAHNPKKYGWLSYAVDRRDPSHLGKISNELEQSKSNPLIHAVSFIFPDVAQAADLAELIRAVGSLPGWQIEDPLSIVIDMMDLVGISLRFNVGTTQKCKNGVWSEVLGFGPFDFLASTRHSPFTEIALRIQPENPIPRPEHKNKHPCRANLDDIPMDPEKWPSEHFSSVWNKTILLRLDMLRRAYDPRAKAKVTFALPRDVWYA